MTFAEKSERSFWILTIVLLIAILALIGTIVLLAIYLTEQNECNCNDDGNDQGSDDTTLDVPEVITSLGTIKGRVLASPLGGELQLEEFMGIPFAKPPIGQRRFANPEPYGSFPGGVWKAFDPSPACIQNDAPAPPDIGEQSEDCLYLNVWRPRPVRDGRAVMVWIYGGGFNGGSSMIPASNGTMLASYGDIVYVSMNYRLNVFGFFHTGDNRMANGNFGLLDQQLALQWIHDHIVMFGGDPNLVTIFGESAGGASAAHQLLLPGAQGLFTRAILQSGDSATDWASDPLDERVRFATQSLANNTNCTNDDTLLNCLRDLDGEVLLNEYFSSSFVSSSPKVDGVTIRDNPETLLQNGDFIKADIMIGYTQNEGSMFIYFIPGVTPRLLFDEPWTAYINACRALGSVKNQTDEEIEDIIEAYMPEENTTEVIRVTIADMYGDNRFICPGEFSARWFNNHGVNVYGYLLTLKSSYAAEVYPSWYGVPHGDDIQWVLGWPWHLEEVAGHDWTEEEGLFSLEVMAKWASFAKYGNPTVQNGLWTPYTASGPAYLELAGPGDFIMFSNSSSRPDRCKLWRF